MGVPKTTDPVAYAFRLFRLKPNATAQVWQYSAANLQAIQCLADQPVTATGWNGTFPAESITLYRLTGKGITLQGLPRLR